MQENDNTGSEDPRLAELLSRRAAVEQRLAAALANMSELQEEALMLVPQSLLPLVQGGTVADFKVIHAQMTETLRADVASISLHARMTESLMADMDSIMEPFDKPST